MAWVAVAVGVIGAAGAVYQGEEGRKASSKAERSQKAAQRDTLLRAVNEERRSAQAERKANRKKPDVTSILFQEQAASKAGPGSTILAGATKGGGRSLLGSKTTLMG